jgi:GT2 family glycosyltransferase
MELKHSIILLTYSQPLLLEARLSELGRLYRKRSDVEILVYDNGSTDKRIRLILHSRAADPDFPLVCVRNDINQGFGPGFNKAVAHSRGAIIHLLSDDVIIYGDFLGPVDESLRKQPLALICKEIVPPGAGWNDFGDFHLSYPAGYYLAMGRAVWEGIGGFDERFSPVSYEDVDLGMKIIRSPDGVVVLEEIAALPLRHLVARTAPYTGDRYEHTVRMRALFAEKWGLKNRPERP